MRLFFAPFAAFGPDDVDTGNFLPHISLLLLSSSTLSGIFTSELHQIQTPPDDRGTRADCRTGWVFPLFQIDQLCNSFHFFALGTGHLSYSLHFSPLLRYCLHCTSFHFFPILCTLHCAVHFFALIDPFTLTPLSSRRCCCPRFFDASTNLASFPHFLFFKEFIKNVDPGHIQRLKAVISRGSAGNENPVQSSQNVDLVGLQMLQAWMNRLMNHQLWCCCCS